MDTQQKLAALKSRLEGLGSLAVAFSGGVDSTFLLKVAHDCLGERAVAVTVSSPAHFPWELEEAAAFAEELGVRHVVIGSGSPEETGLAGNPADRCYRCKKVELGEILEAAAREGIAHVADGSNADDLGDYRPGRAALKELGVRSPLIEAGLTKDEIRLLSRQMGLATWDRPARACLYSRFPYGQTITAEKVAMVARAEQELLDMGFRQVRVRHHGDIARIEVAPDERCRFFDEALLDRVHGIFREIGFPYAALDLAGYRTGSMNETLPDDVKREHTGAPV